MRFPKPKLPIFCTRSNKAYKYSQSLLACTPADIHPSYWLPSSNKKFKEPVPNPSDTEQKLQALKIIKIIDVELLFPDPYQPRLLNHTSCFSHQINTFYTQTWQSILHLPSKRSFPHFNRDDAIIDRVFCEALALLPDVTIDHYSLKTIIWISEKFTLASQANAFDLEVLQNSLLPIYLVISLSPVILKPQNYLNDLAKNISLINTLEGTPKEKLIFFANLIFLTSIRKKSAQNQGFLDLLCRDMQNICSRKDFILLHTRLSNFIFRQEFASHSADLKKDIAAVEKEKTPCSTCYMYTNRPAWLKYQQMISLEKHFPSPEHTSDLTPCQNILFFSLNQEQNPERPIFQGLENSMVAETQGPLEKQSLSPQTELIPQNSPEKQTFLLETHASDMPVAEQHDIMEVSTNNSPEDTLDEIESKQKHHTPKEQPDLIESCLSNIPHDESSIEMELPPTEDTQITRKSRKRTPVPSYTHSTDKSVLENIILKKSWSVASIKKICKKRENALKKMLKTLNKYR